MANNGNNSYPQLLPSLFDRCDGSQLLGGTAPPAGSILLNSVNGYDQFGAGTVQIFEELSDSPSIESAEQSTVIHRFQTDYTTAKILILTNPRGTVLTDSNGNVSRVLSSKMETYKSSNGQVCIVTITAEAMDFANPPDEFSIETSELNPAIEKHPRYNTLSYSNRYLVDQHVRTDNPDLVSLYANQLLTIPNTPVDPVTGFNAQSQSFELINKKNKGEDSFYLSSYKITWTQYYWNPQEINPGGYIEDPIYKGGLPAACWSSNGQTNGTNIFDQTTIMNANLYPVANNVWPYGISWLRQTDTQVLQRTWWRLTRTWIGATIGFWDKELYTPTLQPSAYDYNSGGIYL